MKMITKKGLTLFGFLLFSLGLHGQTGLFSYPVTSLDEASLMVIYNLTCHEDTSNYQHCRKERMLLLIGKQVSWFQSYNNYQGTIIMRQKDADGTLLDWLQSGEAVSVASTGDRYQIYKNYPESKTTTLDHELNLGVFQYEEPYNGFEWNILDDTMAVSGYMAQKATCSFGGRSWEAWFTDELPFSDGPYKFCGLPGLIIKLVDSRNHYCFELFSIEVPPKGTIIEWAQKDYNFTTKKGFFKVSDNLRESILHDNNEQVSDEMQKKLYYYTKSKNNPIELDRK